MPEVVSLTEGQFGLVYSTLSLAIAAMGASFVFFLLAQNRVAPKYRLSLVVSALVVGIATYHYVRIFNSWVDTYAFEGGLYASTGLPFTDSYRYVDWLLTVPLLVTELILVLALAREVQGKLITTLSIAAVAMILLGFPGEIAQDTGTRALWGALSTIPFVYILYVLWARLGAAISQQPPRVAVLFRNTRLLLLATWGFYPIVYMAPFLGISGASAEVTIQVGYAVADILAKAAYGVMIYAIAREKTTADGWLESTDLTPATASAA